MNRIKVIVILICLSFLMYSFTDKDNRPKTLISGIIITKGKPIELNKIILEFPDYIHSAIKIPISIDSLLFDNKTVD